jgi:hypothetical protein
VEDGWHRRKVLKEERKVRRQVKGNKVKKRKKSIAEEIICRMGK